MKIWTTFCPQKICWELTNAYSKGKVRTSDWRKNKNIINNSLKTLRETRLAGIRLVIYPTELTTNGEEFNFRPILEMLFLCQKNNLLVDLCIGPFQYPNYPGIWIPKKLHKYVDNPLDKNKIMKNYGLEFIKKQIMFFGNDKRIRGFYLGNEWPDLNKVKDNEKIKTGVSKDFMMDAIRLIKKYTDKNILLNTNIDASFESKMINVFKDLFNILEKQGKLGLDIYPSQATWKHAPLIKFIRIHKNYLESVKKLQLLFKPSEIFYAEVEAQPWGHGESWYEIITKENFPNDKFLIYTKDSLPKTLNKYILRNVKEINLWGADFWLTAKTLNINWPLEQIRKINKLYLI